MSPESRGSLGNAAATAISQTAQFGHDFTMLVATPINSASLLAQSASGNTSVHSIDIDIVSLAGATGVTMAQGATTFTMSQGASEQRHGENYDDGTLGAMDDFTLTAGTDGDVVRVRWTEIV